MFARRQNRVLIKSGKTRLPIQSLLSAAHRRLRSRFCSTTPALSLCCSQVCRFVFAEHQLHQTRSAWFTLEGTPCRVNQEPRNRKMEIDSGGRSVWSRDTKLCGKHCNLISRYMCSTFGRTRQGWPQGPGIFPCWRHLRNTSHQNRAPAL